LELSTLVPAVLPVLLEAHFVAVKLEPTAGARLDRPKLAAVCAWTALLRALQRERSVGHFGKAVLKLDFLLTEVAHV
jgi:hypothetical protein